MVSPLFWKDQSLYLLDQRCLPGEITYQRCMTWQDVARAIENMVIRGAPAIGIASAFGVALAAWRAEGNYKHLVAQVREAIWGLSRTRPTAQNLFWALARMEKVLLSEGIQTSDLPEALLREAESILLEDQENNRRIGSFGQELISDSASILTHCNAGALATGGYGTALGVIRAAWERGKRVKVWVSETRPFFQGARLTAWELNQLGIPVTVIIDSSAGFFISRREVDLVVVGADRIASNGDCANKIGTYSLAVLARTHRIPFYVAAPMSTVDMKLKDGSAIPVEERSEEEVIFCGGKRIVPQGVKVRNPAFDVTPAELIDAIITERGIIRPPFENSFLALNISGAHGEEKVFM